MRKHKYIRVYMHMYISLERKYSHVVTISSVDISVQYKRDTETVPSAQEISKFPLGDFLVFKIYVVQEDALFK